MKLTEAALALILFFIFLYTPGIIAPVTCTTPEPMTVFNMYPFIWATIATVTGFIIGVILLFGKELLERRFNEA